MRNLCVSLTNAVVFITAVLPVHSTSQQGAVEPNGKVPKVAFFSIAAVGHLQPLLSLAEEMGLRGWEALVVTTEEAENYIQSVALRNATLEVMFCDKVWERGMAELREELLQNDIDSITSSNDWSLRWLTESQIWDCVYERGLDILTKKQVDLMVIDVLTFAGFDIAEKLKVPYVVNHAIVPELFAPMPQANALPMLLSGSSIHKLGSVTSLLQRIFLPFLRPLLALYNKHKIHWPLDRKRAKFGLSAKDQFDIHRNRLILVEHVLGVEYSRPIHPLMHFVGYLERRASVEPPLNSAESDWLGGEQPVIYVSFGTIFRLNKDRANVLLEGLSSDRFRVLWSLKSFGDLSQSLLSANVRIAPWVSSQLQVLAHPNVEVFISHCGDNSLYESIKMGTPLLCIPIGLDQLDCALRGFDAGVARVLDKQTFTAENIHREIEYILQKQSQFQNSLRRAQDLLKLAGGVTRAADLVEHVHAFGTEHLHVHSGCTLGEMFNLDVLFIQFCIMALIAFCWPCYCCGRCRKSEPPKIEKMD